MANPSPESWMARAVALSRRGFPAPNPRVGCVLVKDGESVGEGFHAYAGGPHAEAVALAEAGDRARGAAAYVTLEPCRHFGRTPPCAEALIRAGVEKVAFAVPDPNAQAAGGAVALRQAGIQVEQGLLAQAAEEANRRWMRAMRRGSPFLALKAAIGADGRMSLRTGESQWITGEAARRAGRRLRAELGAVLVGSGTVAADDPRLTARIRGVRRPPDRIVLDPSGRLSGSERLFAEPGPIHWWVEEGRALSPHATPIPGADFGWPRLLQRLWGLGITGVLVEGGAETLARALASGSVDEIHLFVAPAILGDGPSWARLPGIASMEDVERFRLATVKRIGDDAYLRLERLDP